MVFIVWMRRVKVGVLVLDESRERGRLWLSRMVPEGEFEIVQERGPKSKAADPTLRRTKTR